ncbi:hypothetical protein M3204_15880 [Mesobacillus subterraneus]|uniref:hypothetical protein n=1 Tax=Mesobacillus subterraneus TaxID=285983 RepID=UPI00203F1A7C|nr:hypothetical protein [Mesobacillus subterraneus]MCM3665895.1 hypothetical protein [Mesobacillus subterraneus]MCM3684714.1 hypothetical protein [Mesobacillus subterraneus]
MPVFPGEDELISLFECEPTLLDNHSKDTPFYYNEAKFNFTNQEEEFDVTISPSYGEVKIQVKERNSTRLITLLDLKRVEKFEITSDKKERSSILMTIINEETQQTVEVDFKPNFKLIFKEHLTR